MKKYRAGSRTPRTRRTSLFVEACEPRRLLATFMVTTAADNGNNIDPTPGSLRAEILLSDASPAPSGQTNLISFDIAGSSTIAPPVDLPEVTVPTVIDGLTQSGTPVVLDGAGTQDNAANETVGLEITASGSTVEGLTVDQFSTGIYLDNSSNNQILHNQIGTDPTGETSTGTSGQSLGNLSFGLDLYSSSSNLIEGNVISGNTHVGIEIESPSPLLTPGGPTAPSEDNTIASNEIGTDATGTKALPNQDGIDLFDALSNTIGGTAEGAGNIISGNTENGVTILDSGGTGGGPPSADNLIEGNKIGTDPTGTQRLGNGTGVNLENGVTANTIGGTSAGAGNIISNSTQFGVYDGGSSTKIAGNTIDANDSDGLEVFGTGPTMIQGNLIGTNAQGSTGLGNQDDGILISGDDDVTVLNNVVSGSVTGDGIDVFNSANTDIEGNLIGTDLTGTLDLGNHDDGIFLDNASNVRIYGSVIAGSVTGDGISAEGTTTDLDGSVAVTFGTGLALIQDHIGVNLAGTAAIPNAGVGVRISGPVPIIYPIGEPIPLVAPDVVIVDPIIPTPAPVVIQADVISGNLGGGVVSDGVPQTVVESSLIGTNAAGTAAIANQGAGLQFVAASTTPFSTAGPVLIQANVISGNTGDGIDLESGLGTKIAGNIIGTGYGGTESIPNGGDGIDLENVNQEVSITGNQVVNNQGDGIGVHGNGAGNAENTYIAYNEIGTLPLASGGYATGMGNLGNGIAISDAYAAEVIGNVIDSNGVSGVATFAADLVTVEYNQIGIDSDNNPGNRGDGIQFTYSQGLIQDNAIGSSGTDGVALLNSSNTTLYGNFIGTDAEGHGAYLPNQGNGLSIVSDDGQVSTNDSINFNTILANRGNGVEVQGVAENVYFNINRIGGDLLSLFLPIGLVAGNDKDGVLLDDVTAPAGSTAPSVVLTGNSLEDNNLDGLQVIGGGSIIVTADTFKNNAGNGIEFASNAMNDTLDDDMVLANQAFGVVISQSSNITLNDLTIENNFNNGLNLSDSNGIVINGGTDSNNDLGGIATPFV